ncbi:hypothetical protein Bca4012_072834 [Brassica carinata]
MSLSIHSLHALRHIALCMSVRMRSSQILRHLELRLVKLHVQHPCTSTPRPCVDTQVLSC